MLCEDCQVRPATGHNASVRCASCSDENKRSYLTARRLRRYEWAIQQAQREDAWFTWPSSTPTLAVPLSVDPATSGDATGAERYHDPSCAACAACAFIESDSAYIARLRRKRRSPTKYAAGVLARINARLAEAHH